MTKELKNSIKMVFTALVAAFAIAGVIFAFTFEAKISEAFQNGYEQAILDAELVAVSENGYSLSFQGEEHYYSFS